MFHHHAALAYVPADTKDVTASVTITGTSIQASAFNGSPFSGGYAQTVTVTNTSKAAIPEPISLVLYNLPGTGVDPNALFPTNDTPLKNQSGAFSDGARRYPFITLADVGGAALQPGRALTVQLHFDVNDPTFVTYNARALIPNVSAGPLKYAVDGAAVTVGSLNPLELGDQFPASFASDGSIDPSSLHDIQLTVTNVSKKPVTLDGSLPADAVGDTFGYAPTTANFRLGFPQATAPDGVVFDTDPLATDGQVPRFFGSNTGAQLEIYDATDPVAKVLAPGESIGMLVGVGVTGLVTGDGSLIKGSGQFPLYAYDGESAAFTLPVAGSKQSLVIRHAEQSPAQVALPTATVGQSLTTTVSLYDDSTSPRATLKLAAGNDGNVVRSGGSVAVTSPPDIDAGTILTSGQRRDFKLTFPTGQVGPINATFSVSVEDGFGTVHDYTLVFTGVVTKKARRHR